MLIPFFEVVSLIVARMKSIFLSLQRSFGCLILGGNSRENAMGNFTPTNLGFTYMLQERVFSYQATRSDKPQGPVLKLLDLLSEAVLRTLLGI